MLVSGISLRFGKGEVPIHHCDLVLEFFDTIKISEFNFYSGKISDFQNKILEDFNKYLLHLGE